RVMPDNPPSTAMGHASHLLWRLHHRLALQQPKLGEMIALRSEAVVTHRRRWDAGPGGSPAVPPPPLVPGQR
ncbi:MAG TPA: hypothetical protein VM942_01960, partial [Acidimicrobiales bacterium]|nr:hypothetical protein [Acidimicrobiales bacterium]